jgi:hypothetical protein
MPAGRSKLFILGVGAQKAGTSWLHKQLCSSPLFDPGFAKEYHTFDSLYSPVCGDVRLKLLRASRRAIRSLDNSTGNRQPNPGQHTKRLSFIESTDNYFDYFDYLWLSNQTITSTGDITPSYSTLDAKAFAIIREGLIRKGFTPKVVFLMRDPIERIWSMLRMGWRNQKQTVGFEQAMKKLLACHRLPGIQLRTQYDRTITELEKIFLPHELYYGFYEELFSKDGFNPLMEFVETSIPTPNFTLSINASPKGENTEPTPEVATEIAKTYRSVYEFIQARFGTRASSLWPSYQYYQVN